MDSFVNLAHAAAADASRDLVRAELTPARQLGRILTSVGGRAIGRWWWSTGRRKLGKGQERVPGVPAHAAHEHVLAQLARLDAVRNLLGRQGAERPRPLHLHV